MQGWEQWRPRFTCPLNRVILLPLTTGGSARPGAASQAISKLSRIAGFLPSRGHERARPLRCGLRWAERQNAANPGLVQDGGAEHGELQRGVWLPAESTSRLGSQFALHRFSQQMPCAWGVAGDSLLYMLNLLSNFARVVVNDQTHCEQIGAI